MRLGQRAGYEVRDADEACSRGIVILPVACMATDHLAGCQETRATIATITLLTSHRHWPPPDWPSPSTVRIMLARKEPANEAKGERLVNWGAADGIRRATPARSCHGRRRAAISSARQRIDLEYFIFQDVESDGVHNRPPVSTAIGAITIVVINTDASRSDEIAIARRGTGSAVH